MFRVVIAVLALFLAACSAANIETPDSSKTVARTSSEVVYSAPDCVARYSPGCHKETITVKSKEYICWVIPVGGWTVFAPASPLPWVPTDAVTYPLYYLTGHNFWVGYRDLEHQLWNWSGPFEDQAVTVPRSNPDGNYPDLADDHISVVNNSTTQELPIWFLVYND